MQLAVRSYLCMLLTVVGFFVQDTPTPRGAIYHDPQCSPSPLDLISGVATGLGMQDAFFPGPMNTHAQGPSWPIRGVGHVDWVVWCVGLVALHAVWLVVW